VVLCSSCSRKRTLLWFLRVFLEFERDCFLDQVIRSLLTTTAEGLNDPWLEREFQLRRFQVDSLACLGMVFLWRSYRGAGFEFRMRRFSSCSTRSVVLISRFAGVWVLQTLFWQDLLAFSVFSLSCRSLESTRNFNVCDCFAFLATVFYGLTFSMWTPEFRTLRIPVVVCGIRFLDYSVAGVWVYVEFFWFVERMCWYLC